jgi:hypothetical protein
VPVAFNHAFANGIPSRKSHEIVMEYLRPRIWGGRTILLVSPLPAHFHLYDVGAIGFKAFNNDRRTTVDEIERGLYDEVLIQQEIVAATGKPIAKTTLEPDLAKETVFERELDGSHFVRVSRLLRGPDGKVIEIGGDAPKDAPKDSAKDPGKDHPAPDDEPVDDTLAGGQGM